MKTCSILCLFSYFLQVSCVPKPIVDGQNATENVYKYQVSLRYPYGDHFCGGSIIADRWVLTAAHCILALINYGYDPTEMQIVAGTIFLDNGGVTYGAERARVHDKYDATTLKNDIALIRTNKKIVFNKSVGKIRLATKRPRDGSKVTITGWGFTIPGTSSLPNVLQTLTTTVFNLNECIQMNPLDPNEPKVLVTNTNICLRSIKTGQTACQGDSGGPGAYLGEQFTITSFTPEVCGGPKPDAYTCVPDYIKWINDEIRPSSSLLTIVGDILGIIL